MIKQMRAAGCYLAFVGPLRQQAAQYIAHAANEFAVCPEFLFESFAKVVVSPPPFLATSCRKLSQSGFVSEFAILFLLMYISLGQFKESSETNVLWFPGT